MADGTIARRKFLLGAGVAGTAVAAGLSQPGPANAQPASTNPETPAAVPAPAARAEENPSHLTLTAVEAAFFAAAADTIIPADELSPSGSEVGIVSFVDGQLASAWGGGAKLYRAGPFRKGKPELGYQLPLTPREYFAAGIVATNSLTRKLYNKDFDRLAAKERESVLKSMERGKADLGTFDGKQFFEALLQIVMEGFFADPIYGGNKNKAGWKMVGFPGLPALYSYLIVEYRGKRYDAEPQSIADFS